MTSSANEHDLIPFGQCDQVIELKPETCRRCGQRLSRVDSDPLRHQVWEFPAFPFFPPYERLPYTRHAARTRVSLRCALKLGILLR